MRPLYTILLAVGLAQAAPATIHIVMNNNDAGPGSLRHRLSIAMPGDEIHFNGSYVIALMADLPPVPNDVKIRGETAPDAVAGPDVTLVKAMGGMAVSGLVLDAASGVHVTGLEIRGFTNGIDCFNASTGNVIGGPGPRERNLLRQNGTGLRFVDFDTSGNSVVNNEITANAFDGLKLLDGASNNVIGGPGPAALGNFIYGNGNSGVLLDDLAGWPVEHNVLERNSIGVDPTGTAAGNAWRGVHLTGPLCQNNKLIDNKISGNAMDGVRMDAFTHGHELHANFIGTDPSGAFAMPNGNRGVYLLDAHDVLIGGPAPQDRNLISGNLVDGVDLNGTAAVNTVQNNIIGLDLAGVAAIPNGGYGIELRNGVSANELLENTVSGNGSSGISINWTSAFNVVRGNKVGLDDAGSIAIGNGQHGIEVAFAATDNVVEANRIGGNANYGIAFADTGSDRNVAIANFVGMDATGTIPLPNVAGGILVQSSDNEIGRPGEGNTIGSNLGWGIECYNTAAVQSGNLIRGNVIGEDATGAPMGNGLGGILVGRGFVDNEVGGHSTVAGAGNRIANHPVGIEVDSLFMPYPTDIRILTNALTNNGGLGIDLGGNGNGLIPAPVVTAADSTSVSGTNQVYGFATTVQVFYDSSTEGDVFVGEVVVPAGVASWSTDSSAWALAGAIPAGQYVTATHTADWIGGPSNETSAFSNAMPAGLGTTYCSPAVANSTGLSGVISAAGSDAVADNDVTLTASDLPQFEFGYFLTSDTQAYIGSVPNSQGALCISGAGRYNSAIFYTGPLGEGQLVLDLANTPTPSGTVAIAAGETWNFTAWYRDLNPSATSNFTDAISIAFH